jgi:Amino acid permease
MDKFTGGPVRAIWLCVVLAFILGIPGLTNKAVLGALFSLTATGLYASYMIPIFLRITISRDTFKAAEFDLGSWSIPMGVVSLLWASFMLLILCLPQAYPITAENMNYSPIALGIVLVGSIAYWFISARKWFKGMKKYVDIDAETETHIVELGVRVRTGAVVHQYPADATVVAGALGDSDSMSIEISKGLYKSAMSPYETQYPQIQYFTTHTHTNTHARAHQRHRYMAEHSHSAETTMLFAKSNQNPIPSYTEEPTQ